MKIPSKVKIGAYQLDVKFTDNVDELVSENAFGSYDTEKGFIYLKKILPQEQLEQTFLHEILELSVRNICRIYEKDFSHKDFSRFVEMTYIILKDNKLNFGE